MLELKAQIHDLSTRAPPPPSGKARDEKRQSHNSTRSKQSIKYGLVWEDKPEDIVDICRYQLPILKEIKERRVKTNGGTTNIIIEGDNYHALSVLRYTHKGKIDIIYIDPPYNTGNKTWKYNNNFVDKEDSFKHSKWLSFMKKRLKLAKALLSKSGTIIVAIDDYEMHTLRLLMDELFNEKNHIGTIIVVHNPRGRNDDKHFATMHEYMLIYSKDPQNTDVGYFDLTDEEASNYRLEDSISKYSLVSYMRTGNNSDRHTRPRMFYPIYYDKKSNELSLTKTKKSIEILPINNSGDEKVWRWGKKTFLEKKDTELSVKQTNGKYKIYKKRRLLTISSKKPKSLWYDSRYDASSHGIMLLREILQEKNTFPYPKSIWTTYDILKLISNKNSLVLDFFAGSGTTGHAVLQLNHDIKGNRKFILCTNNENGICEDVCYPRLKNVIKGYSNNKGKKITGLGSNLRYFKTEFIDNKYTDKNKKNIVKSIIDVLCVKEDCFEAVKITNEYKIFKNNTKHIAIINDDKAIEPFKNHIKKAKLKTTVYVFSLDEYDKSEEFEDVQELVWLKPVPLEILSTYRRIFK